MNSAVPVASAIPAACAPKALPPPASPIPPFTAPDHGNCRLAHHRSLASLCRCLRLRRHRPENPFLHHGCRLGHRQHGRVEPHAHVAAGHRGRHPRRRQRCMPRQIDLGKSIYRTPNFTWLSYIVGGSVRRRHGARLRLRLKDADPHWQRQPEIGGRLPDPRSGRLHDHARRASVCSASMCWKKRPSPCPADRICRPCWRPPAWTRERPCCSRFLPSVEG
jgi:hypothetical protein